MRNSYTWGIVTLILVMFGFSSLTALAAGATHSNYQYFKPGTLTWKGPSQNVSKNSDNKKPLPVAATSTPVTGAPAQAGEVRMTAYTTAYGWPDNTPAGAAISNPVLHSQAAGTGTYSDPITLAVGHSLIGGKDILDYPAGTKFYLPNLRKYFIVEDTCGDGNKPQNGPCHTGYQGHVWVDLWIGGQGASSSAVLKCEDTVTDTHLLIENPASNYAVVPGAIYSGSCAQQYGNSVVMS